MGVCFDWNVSSVLSSQSVEGRVVEIVYVTVNLTPTKVVGQGSFVWVEDSSTVKGRWVFEGN